MRILLAQNSVYVPTYGGANKSNRLLLEALAARGHACRAVCSGAAVQGAGTRAGFLRELASRGITPRRSSAHADVFHLAGVEVHAAQTAGRLRACLLEQLRDYDPTWILVSSEDPGQNLLEAALETSPERVVFLARTTMTLPFGPDAAVPSERHTRLLSRAAAILCVSEFLKAYVQRWAGYAGAAYLPISLLDRGPFPQRGDPARGYVTMINPCALKGLPIFLGLARRRPEVAFAAVPSWGTTAADRRELEQLGNVTLLPVADDIDEIFGRTRVLLAPSLWAEAWGRVVIEAMLRSIPVMGADIGGIPEAKLGVPYLLPVRPITAFGHELDSQMIPIPVAPEQDLEPWSDALRALTGDPVHYARIASASGQAAQAFVAGHTVEKVERFLLNLERRPAPAAVAPQEVAARPAQSTDLRKVIDALPPDRRALLMRLLAARGPGGSSGITTNAPAAGAPPLSFAQERLWFLHQLHPGSPAYNVKHAFRLRGHLHIRALEQAVNSLIARHDVLRTVFPAQAGRPVAVCKDALSIPLALADLTAVPKAQREAFLQAAAVHEVRRPFSLSEGPLLRAALMRTEVEEHVLLLAAHHIVADAWSFEIFMDELGAAYGALIEGRPQPRPPLPIQYADYARWHREQMDSGAFEPQLAYWTRQLEGDLRPLQLPADFAQPDWQSDAGAARRFTLAASTFSQLNDLARREGVSLYMLLLTAYEVTLRWISGQSDFAIACPIANRTRTETEGLIGFFVNTLVIRARLNLELTYRDLLRAVRDTALGAYAHQDMPFERIVEHIRPERILGANPLCRVLFVLQNVRPVDPRLHTLALEPLEIDSQTTRFDLELMLSEQAGSLSGKLVYRRELFTASTAARISNGYLAALDELASDPDRAIGEIERRLWEAQTAREQASERALQQLAFTTLTQAVRRIAPRPEAEQSYMEQP